MISFTFMYTWRKMLSKMNDGQRKIKSTALVIIIALFFGSFTHLLPSPTTETFAHDDSGFDDIRIHAGGSSFTDSAGNSWSADSYYNTGNTFSVSSPIAGTTDDQLYQTERWDDTPGPDLIYSIPVADGEYEVVLHFAEIYSGTMSPGARVFNATIEGTQVLTNFDIFAQAGGNTALVKTFTVDTAGGALDILFTHVNENPKIAGIEVHLLPTVTPIPSTTPTPTSTPTPTPTPTPAPTSTPTPTPTPQDNLAHAVAGPDRIVVDADNSGSESVTLDGSFSHTHAFGENLVSYVWKEGVAQLAAGSVVTIPMSLGVHTITLVVTDSVGNTASDDVVVTVYTSAGVPGLAAYYYDYSDQDLQVVPNVDLRKPSFSQIVPSLNYAATTGNFSGSPFSDNFATRFVGFVNAPVAGTYTFGIESNDGSKLFIDGVLLINNDGQHVMQKKTGSISLTAGTHAIKIDYFEGLINSGLILTWTKPPSPEEVIPPGNLTHDYTTLLPVVHSISPTSGSGAGGGTIQINGFGFVTTPAQTTVKFGTVSLSGAQVTIVSDSLLEVTAPAGVGTVDVTVQTPNGISGAKQYAYNGALPPIQFVKKTLLSGIEGPTTLAFGPDGKLYVGTLGGEIWILTLDQNKNITNTVVSTTITNSEPDPRNILGIAFYPLDDPTNPRVYVSHSQLFHGQIIDFYKGKISVLSGPNLSVKKDLITGLPVSDHDHGVNGLEFSNNGELYIQIGGNTNAGVPGALSGSGLLDEGYFSAATLIAHINRDNFDGQVTYNSQDYPVTGLDVEVFAAGQRNPFDLVLHSNGKLYGTDNGPNFGFGQKSVTCTTNGSDPEEDDELNVLVRGGYYGHANRKRGAQDSRQCVWRSKFTPSDAQYTAPIGNFPPSTDGITEYWTSNFAGQMRGHLFLSRWNGELFEVELSANGLSVISQKTFNATGGLDVTVFRDGSIFLARQETNEVVYFEPVESNSGLSIISAFPYRGPLNGGRSVILTGKNINPSASTQVSFGGQNCAVTGITAQSITCTVPAGSVPGAVDINVTNGVSATQLSKGFLYMGVGATPPASDWSSLQALPEELGEVSAASMGGYVYIFAGHESSGAENNDLYRYDASQNTWQQLAKQTVVPLADHVAAQAIGGKLYIFGGCTAGGESNALAVYDPATNSWQTKASLTKNGQPYGICSASSAVINGKFYVAGGIHSNTTVGFTFVYDPVTNVWSELAQMPQARNHAAGTGYNGKFYMFGGRCCGGNVNGPGLAESFVYDPGTNSWSQLPNLPTPRAGTGNAAVLGQELLVVGGEGGGPSNGTFHTVEAFDPASNTWRSLADLPTARHGIFPVELSGRVHVVAGGTAEGFSYSNIHEVFGQNSVPPPPPPPPTGDIRIHAGGSSFTDSSGNAWSSDVYYNTGDTYSVSAPIANTTDDQLYQTERWDDPSAPELAYAIPVTNGTYQVTLYFAEIYSETMNSGARVFDVLMEGVVVLDNLDIYSEVGGNAALTKTLTVTVSGGMLDILLAHGTENPKIAGIHVHKL